MILFEGFCDFNLRNKVKIGRGLFFQLHQDMNDKSVDCCEEVKDLRKVGSL